MEKLITCFLLLAVLNCVSAEDQFFGEGGTLLLRPQFSGEITGIQWKHNSDLVAEWVKGAVDLLYYGGFKGRTTLNTTTGSLEIRNITLADSGVYSVEINNRVQDVRYKVVVIKAVPKPVVLLQPLTCTAASEKCTLTCNGNTEKAEPVTYSLKMGGEWMDGEKIRSITNDETIQSVEMFSCRMKNPVSEEESDPIPNPFFKEKPKPDIGTIVGVVVGLVLVVIVVIVIWLYRHPISQWCTSVLVPWFRNVLGNNVTVNGQPPSPAPETVALANGAEGKTDEKNDPPPAETPGDGP